jgi:hypothetical protein
MKPHSPSIVVVVVIVRARGRFEPTGKLWHRRKLAILLRRVKVRLTLAPRWGSEFQKSTVVLNEA